MSKFVLEQKQATIQMKQQMNLKYYKQVKRILILLELLDQPVALWLLHNLCHDAKQRACWIKWSKEVGQVTNQPCRETKRT